MTARVWGMSMTENPSGATSTSVRLTPSTAIEPLGTMQRGPARVEREGEELPLALGPALAEDGRRVDVALDEVAAEPVADAQGPFEVDRRRRPRGRRGWCGASVSGPACTVERVAARPSRPDHGQAAAVDRDALAERERVARRPSPGQASVSRRPALLVAHRLDPAQSFDKSCEHDG